MIRKVKNLFFDIKGDFISCKNRASYLLSFSPVNKKFLFALLFAVFLFTVFRSSSEYGFYLYFLKIIFVSLITFLIFAQSDTYWFLRKKTWSFKLIIKNRKSIQASIKRIKELGLEKEKNPVGAIYVTAYNDLEGYKPEIKRVGIEIIILHAILFFTFPLLFIFNLALFCMMFFYVTFYEKQSSSYVSQDVMTLTNSVKSLYEESPEKCREFIMENKLMYVHELENIYQTVKSAVEK